VGTITVGAFFVGNAIEGSLLQTGAFEILYNNDVIWSKLEAGRLPKPDELYSLLADRMKIAASGGAAKTIAAGDGFDQFDSFSA